MRFILLLALPGVLLGPGNFFFFLEVFWMSAQADPRYLSIDEQSGLKLLAASKY